MSTISFDEFQRLLEDQPGEFDRLITKEMKKSGLRMERSAKKNATGPKENPPRVFTGRLRSSIQPIQLKDRLGVILQAGGQGIVGKDPTTGFVGAADVNYAPVIEFGGAINLTKAFGSGQTEKGRDRWITIRPRLFMGKAVRKEEKELPKKFQKLFELSLTKRAM